MAGNNHNPIRSLWRTLAIALALWSAWLPLVAPMHAQPVVSAAPTTAGLQLRLQLHEVEEERRAPLQKTATDAVASVQALLQTRLQGTVDVDFVGSEPAFDAVMQAHGVEGWDERWLAGLALLDQRRIIVHVNGTRALTTRETLEHELVHVALHSTAGGVYLPRWYQEGAATLLAGEATFERLREIAGAGALGQLDSLINLDEGFRGSQVHIERAYATAAGFVRFATQRAGGNQAIGDLQRRLQEGVAFDRAFAMTFGTAPEVLYRQFAAQMHDSASVLAVLLGDNSIWSLVSLLGLISMLQSWRHRPRFDEDPDAAPVQPDGDEEDGELDLEAIAAAAEAAEARPWRRRNFAVDPLRVGDDAVNSGLSQALGDDVAISAASPDDDATRAPEIHGDSDSSTMAAADLGRSDEPDMHIVNCDAEPADSTTDPARAAEISAPEATDSPLTPPQTHG